MRREFTSVCGAALLLSLSGCVKGTNVSHTSDLFLQAGDRSISVERRGTQDFRVLVAGPGGSVSLLFDSTRGVLKQSERWSFLDYCQIDGGRVFFSKAGIDEREGVSSALPPSVIQFAWVSSLLTVEIDENRDARPERTVDVPWQVPLREDSCRPVSD